METVESNDEKRPVQGVVIPENCRDCRHCEVIADPDPDDWFCDDDKAVVCNLTPNPGRDVTSKWMASHHPQRAVTVSCRPYNLRKECDRPEWCPLQG